MVSVVYRVLFLSFRYLRNPPPKNLCPGGRKKSTLPKEATKVLRNWLDANPRPYPTRETKAALAELTGLSVLQVSLHSASNCLFMTPLQETHFITIPIKIK